MAYNSNKYWTQNEVETLFGMVLKNSKLKDVMAALPGRSFLAIILKMRERVQIFPKDPASSVAKFDYTDQTKSYSDLYVNRGRAWSTDEDRLLKSKFEKGDTILMLMDHFDRSNAAICQRLKNIYSNQADQIALFEQTKQYLRLIKM